MRTGARAGARARVDQTPFIAEDERNRRIAIRKFRLQMLMIMQFNIQLVGVLFASEFKGFDDQLLIIGFGILSLWCVNSIRAGLLGVWENDLQLLEGYFVSSQCATIFTCGFVYNHCRGAESTRTWMGMNLSDLYFISLHSLRCNGGDCSNFHNSEANCRLGSCIGGNKDLLLTKVK